MADEIMSQGAEVVLQDVTPASHFDRVIIHDSGWVECLHKAQDEVHWYPPHMVAAIHTVTTDEQDSRINDGDT
jgi:hypothetical protein